MTILCFWFFSLAREALVLSAPGNPALGSAGLSSSCPFYLYCLIFGPLLCSLTLGVFPMQLRWGKVQHIGLALGERRNKQSGPCGFEYTGVQCVLLLSGVGRRKRFWRGEAEQSGAVIWWLFQSSGKNSCPAVETFCCVFVFHFSDLCSLSSPSFYVLWVYSGLCCVLTYFRFVLKQLTYLSSSTHEDFTCSSGIVLCGRAGWAALRASRPPASDSGTQATPVLWFLQLGAHPGILSGRLECGTCESEAAPTP